MVRSLSNATWNHKLAVVDWDYNAWGGKYPPFDLDEVVPTRIAEHLRLPLYYPGLVMEGGSFDPNGTGSLLTTTSCLLNPNRNPGKSKIEIEQSLRDYLGVTNILWLGDGIEGDDTDGHIDDISRFVGRTTVLTAVEEDPNDPNFEPLQANLALLRTMKAEDGTPTRSSYLADAAASRQGRPPSPGQLRKFLHC